jgi:hypothetical protein
LKLGLPNHGIVGSTWPVDRFGRHFDRYRIDFAVTCDGRQARAYLRRLALVEMRRLIVEHFFEVPDHGIGIEGRTIVELHARHELAGPFGHIHLPCDQRIVERVAGELVGACTAIGLAGRLRDVGQRNAVAQGTVGSLRAREVGQATRADGGAGS